MPFNGSKKTVNLVSGKKYYVNFMYNVYGVGILGAKLAFWREHDARNAFRDLDNYWFRIPNTTYEMIEKF